MPDISLDTPTSVKPFSFSHHHFLWRNKRRISAGMCAGAAFQPDVWLPTKIYNTYACCISKLTHFALTLPRSWSWFFVARPPALLHQLSPGVDWPSLLSSPAELPWAPRRPTPSLGVWIKKIRWGGWWKGAGWGTGGESDFFRSRSENWKAVALSTRSGAETTTLSPLLLQLALRLSLCRSAPRAERDPLFHPERLRMTNGTSGLQQARARRASRDALRSTPT